MGALAQWLLLLVLSHISRVRLFATPWTVACQAPLSMRFSRQEYWSRLPFPPPGCLPNPGSNPCLLHFLYWQEGSLPMGKLAKTVEPTSEFSTVYCDPHSQLIGFRHNEFKGLLQCPGEGNGNLLQYSCLVNPMDRGAWPAIVHGVTKGSDTT